ncbi:MAG: hypothetical protein OXN21_03655 [Chloroflexota bacterium]|nr:hypothetical protein [Chloroflexota bacterium]MDE2842460.1 hypothetical protein [Chloroflexota bacterium]
MLEQKTNETTLETTTILERIAQQILVAYAWVSGPAMSEQDRIKEELAKSHRLEMELDSTSIVG